MLSDLLAVPAKRSDIDDEGIRMELIQTKESSVSNRGAVEVCDFHCAPQQMLQGVYQGIHTVDRKMMFTFAMWFIYHSTNIMFRCLKKVTAITIFRLFLNLGQARVLDDIDWSAVFGNQLGVCVSQFVRGRVWCKES